MKLANIEVLVRQLFEAGCIRFGEFKLKTGQLCPYYINLRLLSKSPILFDAVANYLSNIIVTDQTTIAGIPEGAVPIASVVANKLLLPYYPLRKIAKNYGEFLSADEYQGTNSLVLIEDVVTTGSSIIEFIKKLPTNSVKQVCIVVDRQQGGIDNIKQLYPEIQVDCLINLTNILDFLKDSMDNEEKEIMLDWLSKNKV